MGVVDSAKNKLGELWYRVKAWAHSVPPDVWIGLLIAAATLLVVWLAYRKAGSSSSSGLSTDNPIIGQGNTPFTTPLTSQDVTSPGSSSGLPGVFDISQLWTGSSGHVAGAGGSAGNPSPIRLPSTLAQIIKSATTRDESVTASMSSNTNSAYASMIAISPYVQSIAANVPDESTIARSISTATASSSYATVSTAAAVPSATTRDESVMTKIIQAVTPQPKPAPAPIRTNPYVYTSQTTSGATQRGTNVSY